MFETGQPLHFFDLDKLSKGKKKTKVVIRCARANETIKTLDGTEQKLNSQMLLIADEKEAIAVAGVMGGENSEVDDQTKNILIEAAVFDKTSIRKTSKLLTLRSEAVSRFEKGLPLTLPEVAIDRAGQLLSELAKGRLTKGKVDNLNKWIWVQHLGLSVTRTNQFLGTSIKNQEIVNILQSLGFEASKFDIVDEAKKHLGKPYLYGAKYRINKTDAFDCSYLTDYIYSLIDKQIGHTSLGQLHHGWEVKDSELKAGDILFYKGHIEKSATNEYHDNDGKGNHSKVMTDKYPDGVGHNGLYIGNGQVIHAAAFEYKNEKWQEKAKADQKVEIVPVDYFTKNPEYLGARRYCENLDELVTVTVPWWREDIKCNADLYEEVARIFGYDKVPATLPNMRDILPKNNQNYKFTNNLRQLLSNIGLAEVFTYPFVSGKALSALGYNPDQAPKVANPLLKEQEYLRTSLVPSMLGALSDNQYENEIIQFFEISQTFENVKKKDLPREKKYLCVGIKNDRGEQACFDFAKGVLDRILREYRVENNNASDEVWRIKILTQGEMDYFGLKKKVAVLEIDLDKIKKIIPKEKTFQTISKYPRVNRDISAIFDKSCPAKEIIDLFKNTSPFIFETSIVDIYEGKTFANNEKSVTVRITLLSFEKTLNDQEIDNVISACIKKIRSIGGKIRDAEQ